MPKLPARSLLTTFDAKISEFDGSLVAMSDEIARLETEIAEANRQREAAYLSLAGIYCENPAIIGAEYSEINRKLQAIFDAKAKRRALVNGELSEAAELTSGLREQLKSAGEETKHTATQLEILAETVRRDLDADKEYKKLAAEHEEATALVEGRQSALEKIVAEATAKLSGYDKNRAFSYLVKCGYGTPHRSRRAFIRFFDDWVARLVSWEEQFPAYQILRDLPDFAKRRLQEAQEKKRFLRARLALRLNQAEASCGAENARQEHARLTHKIDDLRKKIAEIDEHCSVLMKERRELDFAQDPFANQAKNEIKNFLATESIQQLKTRAERSAEPRDDVCVAAIEKAEQTVNDGRRRVRELLAERSTLEQQRARALTAQRKFSREYTGRYDYFDDGFDFNALFLGYILGQHTETIFWHHLDRSYVDDTPRHSSSSSWFDTSSSSSGGSDFSPSSFGSDSSGGFSGGGGDSGSSFSSGGGDSGSSFSTGGGD